MQNDWQVLDERGRRKYLTATERKRFLAAADELPPSLCTFCYVLAYTGCRVSEALALTIDRLDIDRLTVTFRTLKRRRSAFRVLPIPEELAEMLLALPTREGRFWRMHRSTAWRQVKRAMTLAGIEGPMASPKGLRHGFCLHAAVRNVPPNLIQRWAGHASPTTTAIYLDAVGVEERQFAARMW